MCRAHDPYAYAGLLFFLQGPVFPVIAVFRRPRSWLTLTGMKVLGERSGLRRLAAALLVAAGIAAISA